ncbi:(2Fe-2S)-binding protein [Maritimibacter sp. 55A14]|uniref:aromatic ring-hydroxylating oxygenase subunit alpha n=1 Tax=Maritimibacter sp. 55A14 TaxID=2174844 RepID=UPI000D61E5E3|nr:aromatic ring-hydroxylating dioxygenase subunit alpha [Maritimibacter sp. 55A14]PWE33209.1 (2Fe-2S)-binding protein [Maritimibacter sp. 55A14]
MPRHDDLSAVLRDVTHANGLPNAHYVDPAMFEEEKKTILHGTWAGLGFGKDVPEPGDANPVDFLGLPLVIVRDNDGEVRVFQNTCRHRGMILVQGKGKLRGMIRCPYHSWSYSLKGKLVATPHVGGPGHNTHAAVDRDTLGLVEMRSHVWRDVVFVNISGDAPDFAAYASDLMERWKEFDQPVFHGGPESGFKLEVNTNWKLAVENYCESYHLPWVHPGLNSYSRLEDHYNIEQPGAYSGQGTMVYRQFRGRNGELFPDFAGLSPKWNEGAEYVAFYPNVLFGVHRDHAFAILLEPKGPERTIEHIELYYATDATDPGLREANAVLWKTVFEEDIGVVEGMQKGRHGDAFDGGRFSPAMDGPTHNFHAWVAERLSAARGQMAAE